MTADSANDDRTSRPEDIAYLSALCRCVPYHITEAVLADPTERAIAPQVFHGSILYADMVGFTALCEMLATSGKAGLSHLSHLLNRLFELLIEQAVFPYDGYIIQFGGDSINVVFRGDDHARRCGAAAVAAQRIMFGEGGRLLEGQTKNLMLRIGIATGEIGLPVLGDISRCITTTAGKTAHRALKLQRLAMPGAIVVDNASTELIATAGEFVDRSSSHSTLRGLREWPECAPVQPLAGRVESQVHEKTALLEPFVMRPLAQGLRTTPVGWRIEGELRRAVVVFSELIGLDRSQDLEIVQSISRSLLWAYRKYGGVVSKVNLTDEGHRLMVVFGLHSPTENDNERALLAALEATARFKSIVLGQPRNFTIHTGVHDGMVYHGSIGSDYRYDFTIIGDDVNLAARVSDLAGPFQVLATEAALNDIGEEFEHSARDPVQVKGKSDPVSVSVIHSTAPKRARYVHRRKGDQFFAGRAEQSNILRSVVEDGLWGSGAVVGICGEAGVGKSSSLSLPINQWIEGRGAGMIGRCRLATRSMPLAPILSFLSTHLGLTSGDTDQHAHGRIIEMFKEFHHGTISPELLALIQPLHRPDGSTELLIDLTDSHAQERVLSSIIRFIERRASIEPILYVIEDIHLADTMTLQLIMQLAVVARKLPFLMVCTYRPEPLLADLRRAISREIELKSLTEEDTTDLVCHELQGDRVDPQLARFVYERSNGVPRYMLDIVRMLRQRHLVEVRGGDILVVGGVLKLLDEVVPTSLSHVAMSRLHHLTEVERRVLRTASAIGRRFSHFLVESVSGDELELDMLDSGLTSLIDQNLIVPDGKSATGPTDNEQGYQFRDDVTQAVAYGSIPEAERRVMHRRIADILESLPDESSLKNPTVLAFHRERAAQFTEAVHWYEESCRYAAQVGLDSELGYLVQRWRELLPLMPKDQVPDPKVEARMALFQFVATARQRFARDALVLGRVLISTYKSYFDQNTRYLIDYWLGFCQLELGSPDSARKRLLRVYSDSENTALRCDAARILARIHEYAQQLPEARTWLDKAQELAEGDVYRRARIAMSGANVMADEGDYKQAIEVYQQVLDDPETASYVSLRQIAVHNQAYCQLTLCQFSVARQGFERCLEMDRSLGRWADVAIDLTSLGQTYLWEGLPDSALPILEKALAMCRDIGEESQAIEAQIHLGAAIALTSDLDEGQLMVQDGQEEAQASQVLELEIVATLHLARIAMFDGQESEAERLYHQAQALTERMSTPLFERMLEEIRGEIDDMTWPTSRPPKPEVTWIGQVPEPPEE